MKHKHKVAGNAWKYNLVSVSNENKKIIGCTDLTWWARKATKKYNDTWNKYGTVKICVQERNDLASTVCQG